MRIVLIGNYLPDRQESMIRFSEMLNSGFNRAGIASEIWLPKVLFGKGQIMTSAGIGKWLGYVDKWILFPILLRRRVNKEFNSPDIHFHICDHSNAPYLKHLPLNRTGITCHDVIAIRSGLFNNDQHVQSSSMGKLLQKWILSNLKKAELLAAVSSFTLTQLKELVPENRRNSLHWKIIYNSFNAPFGKQADLQLRDSLLHSRINPAVPFLLHVGSDLPRKNRKLLIDMLHQLGNKWEGVVCFAGDPLEEDLLLHADRLGLRERVMCIVKPDHELLVTLYNAAAAFIFPSFSEGFGWPVIEAQACGTPVIASNLQPMPEISGGAAIHCDPYSPEDFGKAFLSLDNHFLRSQLIEKGFENVKRFAPFTMIEAYLDLHGTKPKIQPPNVPENN